MKKESRPFDYKAAGVDRDKGHALVENIKKMTGSHNAAILEGIGGFASLYELPPTYKTPVLVTATDGVGTKRQLAIEKKKHRVLGIDLVAMCVNDIICCGAKPLLFLDYYATGKIKSIHAQELITGILDGCHQAGCVLAGGETAEMPGLYHNNDYDIAGFAVGIVDKEHIIKARAAEGSILIGLPSTGVHANGFSLIRHLIAKKRLDLEQPHGTASLAEALLQPTRIYVQELAILQNNNISLQGVAHITGGGITENLPRSLPNGCTAVINLKSYKLPPLFSLLQQAGNIPQEELYRTFNCGIGMILIVAEAEATRAIALLENAGAQVVGKIICLKDKAAKARVDYVEA